MKYLNVHIKIFMEENPFISHTIVSIVIPAKNESETIGTLLTELNDILQNINDRWSLRSKYQFEVIVVNDHSSDDTREKAKAYGVKVVENMRASGKANALKTGFRAASGDIIIMMDADYSHDPKEIPHFLKEIESGADFVIGSRFLGESEEFQAPRLVGNLLFTFLMNLLWGVKLTDVLNGYKAFKADLTRNIDLTSDRFEIEIELVCKAIRNGYNIVEVPSYERARAGGKMKSSGLIDGPKILHRILKEKFLSGSRGAISYVQ